MNAPQLAAPEESTEQADRSNLTGRVSGPFFQPDRPAIETLINALFRCAEPENYISLRAFCDLEDGRAPLFVDAMKVGDPQLLNRVNNRVSEAETAEVRP
jgi:hypothetical protein